MKKEEIDKLLEKCLNLEKACERANQMVAQRDARNQELVRDIDEQSRRLDRLRQFVRDEATRARSYGSQRMAEIFESAVRGS